AAGAGWGEGAPRLHRQKPVFRLPFKLTESERQKLREVQLYVKAGAEPWAVRDAVPPSQAGFVFRAPQDGEYWFSIVTVDKNGVASPADPSREDPARVRVVATQPPDINPFLPAPPTPPRPPPG